MALTSLQPGRNSSPAKRYIQLTRPHEWLDSAPFVEWYDRAIAKRHERHGVMGQEGGAPAGQPPPGLRNLEDTFADAGTNSRRMSTARTEGRVTMNVVLAALEALDPFTSAWELARAADEAVRELVPFRDSQGRDLLEPAIGAVERWYAWA